MKLSDDLHLNEIDCVHLIVSANQEELNREEPAGLGEPHSERCVLDSRGAFVVQQALVSRERLMLGHCLVLSILVLWTSPKDVKDIFLVYKDSASELSGLTTP
ncbi:hypothetical protein ABKV19_008207 [Rosa sericea]